MCCQFMAPGQDHPYPSLCMEKVEQIPLCAMAADHVHLATHTCGSCQQNIHFAHLLENAFPLGSSLTWRPQFGYTKLSTRETLEHMAVRPDLASSS